MGRTSHIPATTPPPPTTMAAVRFRVRKGAKLLFECEVARSDLLPVELQHHLVRADELGLLRDVEIAITKRLNIVEVDRMIACCRQHPPQALVMPVETDASHSSSRVAFEDFAVYLKQRERAGVGSISPGMLVMLIPLDDRNDYLRCQIVNTLTTVGEIGAQVSTVFAPAIDQRPLDVVPVAPTASPASVAAVAPPAARSSDSSSVPLGTTAAGTASQRSLDIGGSATRLQDDLTMASNHDLDPFERLRHEHAAFNAFYHHVLLEWSTKPSDIDSAEALHQRP